MDFDQRRRQKWMAGRRERGLPLDGSVFLGDPCREGMDECVDLANYVEQAMNDGRVPESVGVKILQDVFGIDMILGVYADVGARDA